jgi:electron transport complex protein RnfG
MIARSMLKNSIILAGFALLSTAMVAITDHFTRDRIQSEKALALEKILHQLIAPEQHDNDLYLDCVEVKNAELLGTDKPVKVFRARLNNQAQAVFVQSIAPDGYNGAIELVVGVSQQQQVMGVRVLSHIETPGLGDRIEIRKSSWVKGFNNLSLKTPPQKKWKVKKDGGEFDAFTGATITPRAVVKAVLKTLIYVNQNAVELYQLPSNCFDLAKQGHSQ